MDIGMSEARKKLFSEIMNLPSKERRELALDVLDCTEDDSEPELDPEWEKAWVEEVHRRAEDLASGKDKGLSWDETKERLFRRGKTG
jgi:putative addiction module component (TIGR02574 family)